MQAHLTVLTLCVDDLDRALAFYRDGLGLATPGIVGQAFDHGAVVFIDLQAGLKLALWPRSSLAHDSGLSIEREATPQVSLGHNVRNRAEVDAVMEQAERAGARLVTAPRETFWGGYAGYFQDPDGHLWEIAHNPALPPPDL